MTEAIITVAVVCAPLWLAAASYWVGVLISKRGEARKA